METQLFQFLFYQKLVILLIFFFAGTISGMHISASSDELGRSGSSDSKNPDLSTLYVHGKYIMESYLDKFELQDSNFEDFVAHELPSGLCELLPDNQNLVLGLSVLQRTLIGEGSHRHLSSSIRLQVKPESILQLPTHFCEVIIIERLPSGVFADPFELQHLHQRRVFTDVAVFGDTNLELPSFRSNRSIVEVHMDVGSNILSGQQDGSEINILLPLHARYQPLDEGGYSVVEIGEPDLFMSCSAEGKQHKQSCLFRLPNDDAKSRTGAVSWRIPSGIPAHAGFVSTFTYISALLSTLLIVWTSIFCSGIKASKNLKQS
ncbi:hypothetical protein SLEP1_g9109 [Rubroshorea leprosula]|uniref:Phosphatidylinositol-glycan biosynthesis class X protein n=1 Tax=Rubroshorea leprosula TaxID=152421 RepID=A0AAV5ID58_9ROSI|nr:hypothetical protein SLEP1_g9109 [Rubroshorea leprosula]